MIKKNREKQLNIWVRQVRSPSNTCLTVMQILLQSGASRQEHQKKERQTTTKTSNYVVNKTKTTCKISSRRLFSRLNRKSSKIVTAYVLHTKKRINEQCDSIRCAKNNTMVHSMSPNYRISCVVGMSIFGFKTYWKQVFNLLEIQTSSTF